MLIRKRQQLVELAKNNFTWDIAKKLGPALRSMLWTKLRVPLWDSVVVPIELKLYSHIETLEKN